MHTASTKALRVLAITLLVLLVGTHAFSDDMSASGVAKVARALKSNNPDERKDAVIELTAHGPLAIPYLITVLLTDNDPYVRAAAASELGYFPNPPKELMRSLIEAFDDQRRFFPRGSYKIPIASLESLAKYGTTPMPLLAEALHDKRSQVRYFSMLALQHIGPAAQGTIPILMGLLDDNRSVSSIAPQVIATVGSQSKGTALLLASALKTHRTMPTLVEEIIKAIGKMGHAGEAAVPSLLELLHSDPQYAYLIVSALGNIGSSQPDVVAALRASLRNGKTEQERANAARALGKMGSAALPSVPDLVALLSGTGNERSASLLALQNLLPAMHDSRAVSLIEPLKLADSALGSHSDSLTRQQELDARDSLRREREYLQALWWNRIFDWIQLHPLSSLTIAFYLVLPVVCFVLLWTWPLAILSLNEALETYSDVSLPQMLGGIKVPIRYFIVIGFFHYHSRVLDAWVEKRIKTVRVRFDGKATVRERGMLVDVPVILDGKVVAKLLPEELRSAFANRRACIVISGEGGAGKTSRACQLAKWGMSSVEGERLTGHLMIPILLEPEFDLRVSETGDRFMDAIRGQLRELADDAAPASYGLTRHLLQAKRLMIIADGYSELTPESKRLISPLNPDFHANVLVITSRVHESLDDVQRASLIPMRIQGGALSIFVEEYLVQRSKRDLFSDEEYFAFLGHLSRILAGRDATVLLAKLFSEQMIYFKTNDATYALPESIPDLMLAYLNKLNNSVQHRLDDRLVQKVAKRIAWEHLRRMFRPGLARYDDIFRALGGNQSASEWIEYAELRLRLVETVGEARDRSRFKLDPLAEYLAALYLVDRCGSNASSWRAALRAADSKLGAPHTIRSFLFAILDCCTAQASEAGIPAFVIAELKDRNNMEMDAQKCLVALVK